MSGGLTGGMKAAVSAMSLKSKSMGGIAHNVGNANSVGFKETLVRGKTFVTSGGTGTDFSAGGVTAETLRRIDKQGAVQTADSTTDLAITGKGFFIVNTSTTPSSGTYLYTRAGSFRADKNGYLKNDEGYYLLGWATDSTGTPTASDTSVLSGLTAVDSTSLAGLASATTSITDKATLKANAADAATFAQVVTVYDSLGISHDLTLTWTRDTAGDTAGTNLEWELTVTTADGTVTQSTSGGTSYSTGVPVLFSASTGAPHTINGSTASSAAVPNIYIDWTDGSYLAADSTISLDIGSIGDTDGVVVGGTATSSTRVLTQNGANFGNLTSITTATDGVMTAVFDNGLTRKFYKLPIGVFNDANSLEERDGQAYAATNDSGDVVIRSASSNGAGKITGSALEASTVDIADQFSQMIQVQQEFSANATVIRTVDQMMAEVSRLKG